MVVLTTKGKSPDGVYNPSGKCSSYTSPAYTCSKTLHTGTQPTGGSSGGGSTGGGEEDDDQNDDEYYDDEDDKNDDENDDDEDDKDDDDNFSAAGSTSLSIFTLVLAIVLMFFRS